MFCVSGHKCGINFLRKKRGPIQEGFVFLDRSGHVWIRQLFGTCCTSYLLSLFKALGSIMLPFHISLSLSGKDEQAPLPSVASRSDQALLDIWARPPTSKGRARTPSCRSLRANGPVMPLVSRSKVRTRSSGPGPSIRSRRGAHKDQARPAPNKVRMADLV